MEDGSSGDEKPEESFEELFQSYTAGMGEGTRVGDRIKGRIISGFRTLNEGETVYFTVTRGPKGLQAENVNKPE